VRRADVDYTDRVVLTELLRREKPAFLINAAGYTGKPNVDACELHKSECLLGNAVLLKPDVQTSVTGGHLIDPATPEVVAFVEEVLEARPHA
jgi:dTDP-4-dehydrorhamnose reductase